VLLVNKVDLIPFVDCSLETLKGNALRINPHLTVFETSCKTGAGIAEWVEWLGAKARRRKGIQTS
jgi:hydrogenase nickel incorporation protein HypB